MSRYIPMPAYPDRMPADISFVFEDEKPACKQGFMLTTYEGCYLKFRIGDEQNPACYYLIFED